MRLLIKLRPLGNFLYDKMYYHKAMGLIYSLIRFTEYEKLHDKKGYKFFCFSNIFPYSEEMKKGEIKYWQISSPSENLCKHFKDVLEERKKINIGEMRFEIEEIKTIKPKIKRKSTLISATPIIIRIPEKNYEKYDIPKEFRKKTYVYWRPMFSINAFIKQLEDNLIKKYNEFYNKKIEIDMLFEGLRFLKGPIVNHVVINGKEQKFIGSLWEFWFTHLRKEQKEILEFGIDVGFGERNTFGFGFINVKFL